jgi:ATP-dependent helicase/nuclease subunit B
MPAKVAVGALERLVACPFRFVAQDGWRLREAPEAVDVPGVRERGELVHEVLERFHREASRRGLVPDAATRAEARALLVEVTDEIGARELASGGGSLGELAEWRATLDDYLAWAVSDAADGWRWLDGERPGAAVVAFATGEEAAGTLRIEGRLDRLDVGPDGTLRVVDYKLGAPARLKRITDAPERAAQLAMYAWIASDAGEVGASGYLSLRRGEVTWMPLSLPASDVLRAWRERLPEVLGRIAGGEAMHASGSECGHCASRGLCRKGHWS